MAVLARRILVFTNFERRKRQTLKSETEISAGKHSIELLEWHIRVGTKSLNSQPRDLPAQVYTASLTCHFRLCRFAVSPRHIV